MINLTAVRKQGGRPRVHGNGFIQLDLTERSRLHIWGDPRIPKQKIPTPIHDHVFGFKSTIIVGELLNVIYDVKINKDDGTWKIYVPQIREGEDTILIPTDEWANIVGVDSDDFVSASRYPKTVYKMRPFVFHETFTEEPAATIIIKDGPTQVQGFPHLPRVLVPPGHEPDNDFNRYAADEDMLWLIIEQTLKLRK